jgi:hypothetical protein
MGKGIIRRAFDSVVEKVYGVDRFPEPVQLNFNKKSGFPTLVGLIMTIICYTVVGVYAFKRF